MVDRETCYDTERSRLSKAHSQTGDGKGQTCQDTERNQPSEAHSRSGEGRERDLSKHRKKPTERGALTAWRRQREGIVRTQKETNRARDMGTHNLENAEGEPSQYIETICESSRRVITETSAWNVGWQPLFSKG